jgi:hypothetical protein
MRILSVLMTLVLACQPFSNAAASGSTVEADGLVLRTDQISPAVTRVLSWSTIERMITELLDGTPAEVERLGIAWSGRQSNSGH